MNKLNVFITINGAIGHYPALTLILKEWVLIRFLYIPPTVFLNFNWLHFFFKNLFCFTKIPMLVGQLQLAFTLLLAAAKYTCQDYVL